MCYKNLLKEVRSLFKKNRDEFVEAIRLFCRILKPRFDFSPEIVALFQTVFLYFVA